MNFFGGGSQQAQQGPDPVFAAKTEMEMYTVRATRRKSIIVGSTPALEVLTNAIVCFLGFFTFRRTGLVQQNCRILFPKVCLSQTQGKRNFAR